MEEIREGGGTREVSRCGDRGESEEDKTGQYVDCVCLCVHYYALWKCKEERCPIGIGVWLFSYV